MKKKTFNKRLKLQKENIVNLNQLNLIKGGLKVPTQDYSEFCSVVDTNAYELIETETCIIL